MESQDKMDMGSLGNLTPEEFKKLIALEEGLLNNVLDLISEKNQGRELAEKYRDLYVQELNEDPEENVLPWEPELPSDEEDEG